MKRLLIVGLTSWLVLTNGAFCGAPANQSERNNWLVGVVFKLERMKDSAEANIVKYQSEIAKCDARISSAERIRDAAAKNGNSNAESVARQALAQASAARILNVQNRTAAELQKARAIKALQQIKANARSPEAVAEQFEFESNFDGWAQYQRHLIAQRQALLNQTVERILASMGSQRAPLSNKQFDDLRPGDVLLFGVGGDLLQTVTRAAITAVDSALSLKASGSFHTVMFLREVNGHKLFLENVPGEGPQIIGQEEFLERYDNRATKVARLAEPLNERQGKELFTQAISLAQKNNQEVQRNWFGSPKRGTRYGIWGDEDVVCSEADWVLLNNAMKIQGRSIPKSTNSIKSLAIDFSPADYLDSPYFIVSNLSLPRMK